MYYKIFYTTFFTHIISSFIFSLEISSFQLFSKFVDSFAR